MQCSEWNSPVFGFRGEKAEAGDEIPIREVADGGNRMEKAFGCDETTDILSVWATFSAYHRNIIVQVYE
jgi:hypothetical protein